MKEIRKKYSNADITVIWEPHICIHSAICFRGLPDVFNPSELPWVKMDGSTTGKIIVQVKKCPSGALSYYEGTDENKQLNTMEKIIVNVTENGPILIQGEVVIKKPDGSEDLKSKVTALCRCGGSNNKPYCDGTHRKNGFEG